MKTNWRNLAIVVVLVAAVAAAVALKNQKPEQSKSPEATTPPVASATQPDNTSSQQPQLPRLLDLGATKCIPCKMMEPILEEMKKEYAGKLTVEFIDVWENRDASSQYGVQAIPTQIFFDKDGKEFFRHEGFFSKEDILKTFKDHGIAL